MSDTGAEVLLYALAKEIMEAVYDAYDEGASDAHATRDSWQTSCAREDSDLLEKRLHELGRLLGLRE